LAQTYRKGFSASVYHTVPKFFDIRPVLKDELRRLKDKNPGPNIQRVITRIRLDVGVGGIGTQRARPWCKTFFS
jgi:hypothetical protein